MLMLAISSKRYLRRINISMVETSCDWGKYSAPLIELYTLFSHL